MISVYSPHLKQRLYQLVYSVLLAHFFIALGRDDAFLGIFLNPFYYQDLIFVSLIVFPVCLLVSFMWKKLDQQFSWDKNFKLRLIAQVIGGVILPTILAGILVFAYMSLILDQDIRRTTYFYYELPVSVVVIIMLNLMLGIQYLIPHNKEVITSPRQPLLKNPVVVQSGKSKVLIDPDLVYFVEKEGPVCLVYTGNHSKHVFTRTLEELSNQLQQDFFIRANRQTIIHRKNCLSYETERSGKLILHVLVPPDRKITISQKKAREFKRWLKGSSTT